MTIIRYGLKTKSGSNYYLEDHTHMFGHPTWMLYVGPKVYHVVALLTEDGVGMMPSRIKDVTDFVGKRVVLYKHQIPETNEDMFEMAILHAEKTSIVADVIKFK